MYYSILDKDFLKKFVSQKPKAGYNKDEDLDSPVLLDWKEIKWHITQNSKIFVIAKIEEPKSQDDNPLYYFFLNESQSGNHNIKFIKELTEPIKEEIRQSLSPIFFLNDSNLGYSLSENGFQSYTSKNVLDRWIGSSNIPKEYVLTEKQKLNENNINISEDFRRFQHRSTKILITDNYIFSDKKNISNTLIPLIKNLISNCINIRFNLVIITSSEKFYYADYEKKTRSTAEEVYTIVDSQLQKVFQNVSLQLIVKPLTKEDYHDRQIITNYYRFKFSNSLSFIDKDGKIVSRNSLTVDSFPHIKKNGQKTYGENTLAIIREIKKVLYNENAIRINFSKNDFFSLV